VTSPDSAEDHGERFIPWLRVQTGMWVRSEYSGELAVLTTWLSVLIPWNVTYVSGVAGGALLFVRFPLFQIRYSFGVPIAAGITVTDPLSATAFQRGQALEPVYQLWTVGAAVFAAALVVSAVYYRREAWAESWPVDPVRLLGTLLLGTGVVLAAATYLLLSRGFPGVPIPLGVVFLLLFGGVLLTVDRTA
jgi:phosphatidylserine synthase